MELFDAPNFIAIFFGILGAFTAFGLVVGMLVYAFSYDKDHGTTGFCLLMGALVGLVFGLSITASEYDDTKASNLKQFEAAYQVSIVEGEIPTDPNERTSVLMYTQDGGPKACIVSTDAVQYSVVCDGEELRPVGK